MFENDVKIYGIKTQEKQERKERLFENDVKIYGIKTFSAFIRALCGLRMM